MSAGELSDRTTGILADLRCPVTGAPLRYAGGSLRTPDGAHAYRLVDGVPVLLAPGRSLFDAGAVTAYRPPARWRRARARARAR